MARKKKPLRSLENIFKFQEYFYWKTRLRFYKVNIITYLEDKANGLFPFLCVVLQFQPLGLDVGQLFAQTTGHTHDELFVTGGETLVLSLMFQQEVVALLQSLLDHFSAHTQFAAKFLEVGKTKW